MVKDTGILSSIVSGSPATVFTCVALLFGDIPCNSDCFARIDSHNHIAVEMIWWKPNCLSFPSYLSTPPDSPFNAAVDSDQDKKDFACHRFVMAWISCLNSSPGPRKCYSKNPSVQVNCMSDTFPSNKWAWCLPLFYGCNIFVNIFLNLVESMFVLPHLFADNLLCLGSLAFCF